MTQKVDKLTNKATAASVARLIGLRAETVRNTYGECIQGTNHDSIKLLIRTLSERTANRGNGDLTEERTRLTAAQADKAELELKEREGELVRLSYVHDIWATVGNNLKTRLRSIPHGISHELLACETTEEVRKLLEDQIDNALEELSDGEITSGFSEESEATAETDS